MRLQQFVPPLDGPLVNALTEAGIKTDTDLLLAHDPLTVFNKLPQEHGFSLRAFREMLAQVAELVSAPPACGDKLLEQEKRRQHQVDMDIFAQADDMRVGVPEVDALLGGFAPPRVVEISGDAGSGKTALALQIALRHLASVESSNILWVDSSGEFSPERVSIVLEQLGGPYAVSALERLQISLAFDIEAVHEVLESVRQSYSTSPAEDGTHGYDPERIVTRCIVMDTITSLLGPMLSATSSQGHAIMITFMRQLRAFADLFCLTIIVINTSTRVAPKNPSALNPEAVFETNRKPGLGPSFTFMTDATLWLARRPDNPDTERGDDSTVYTAEVFRSRISRPMTWARFRIKDGLLIGA